MQTHPQPYTRLFPFALLLSAISLSAQQELSPRISHPVDLGVNYTYLHTNILPGCNCFSLNGGGLQAQVALTPHWSAAADFTGTTRGQITPDNYSLTQLTYTFGVRYTPLTGPPRFRPFGEVLAGGAHALGSLSPGNNAIGGSSNALDVQAGGGLIVVLGSHLRIMPAQVDYVLTTFHNNASNYQNDLRLSAGIAFRLHR